MEFSWLDNMVLSTECIEAAIDFTALKGSSHVIGFSVHEGGSRGSHNRTSELRAVQVPLPTAGTLQALVRELFTEATWKSPRVPMHKKSVLAR